MDDAAGSLKVDLTGSGAESAMPGDPASIGLYRIAGRLGSGDTGQVFLGLDLDHGPAGPGVRGARCVAVKAVWPEADDELLTRFHYELATAGRLPAGLGPGLTAWDEAARPRWYATEYLAGVGVDQLLALGHRLPAPSAWLLVDQVARALAASHGAGVVPGHLKPSAVLLTAGGAKVVDFGTGRPADRLRLGMAGQDSPDTSFIAPEEAAGHADPTGAVDVFALGALVWFAMSGEPPFGRGPRPDVLFRVQHASLDLTPLRQTDAALADLVAACLAKDPAARPSPAWLVEQAAAFVRGYVGGAGGGVAAPGWPGGVMALIEQRAAFVQRIAAATENTALLPKFPPAPAPSEPTGPAAAVSPTPQPARPDPMPTLVDVSGAMLLEAALSSRPQSSNPATAPGPAPIPAPDQPAEFPAAEASGGWHTRRVEIAAGVTSAVALILAVSAWLHGGGHSTSPTAHATSPGVSAPADPTDSTSAGAAAATGDSATSGEPTPSQTTPTTAHPPGTGPVASGIAGKCLSVAGGSTADGTPARLADCDGSPSQTWSIVNGTLRLGGKCLDVTGNATANGTRVELWTCNGGSNQRWSQRPDGSLVSAQSGRCLDFPTPATAAGAQLQIWDCGGKNNQRWTMP